MITQKFSPRIFVLTPALVTGLTLGFLVGLGTNHSVRAAAPTGSAKWEKDIASFESGDRQQLPPTNAIVFVGSSSIRLWKTLSNDFAGTTLIQRGFGGSLLSDTLFLAPRIILPYAPRQVVVYAGDNDIAAGRPAADVVADFKSLVAVIHKALPKTHIAFIAIKPSLARWKMIGEIQAANEAIAAWTRGRTDVAYIDIATPMLGHDGKPRPELFQKDGLHLNAEGYKLWTELVRPHLRAAAKD